MADPITLAALRAFVDLNDPELAPGGNRIAYVRTVRDFIHDRNVHSIVVVGSDGATRTIVDAGPSVGSPRWSPDGSRLAYLRHDAKHADDQIVVVRIGAMSGAERVVTHAKNGVEHFSWSPDGTRFVFDTPDDDPHAAAIHAHDDSFVVGDDSFLSTSAPTPSHLWLVPSAGGAAKRLTRGAWSVFESSAPFAGGPTDPSWSPDGRSILINRAANAHSAETDRTSVAAVDVATGHVTELGTVRRYAYSPTFAQSRGRYAYIRPHGPGPVSINDAVVVTEKGETVAAPALDRDIGEIRWSGETLVALAQDRMVRSLAIAPPMGPAQVFDAGRLSIAEYDVNVKRRLAFVASAYGLPPELYVADGWHGTPKAITHENAALRRYDYGRAEAIVWRGPDGEASDGVVIHPPGERSGVRYPLLLWSHGGPEGESSGLGFGEEYAGGYDAGVIAAARGWYSFFPNYRGSNDLGNAHEHGVYRNPGEGPASDVFAGLDAVEKRFPAVDPKREVVGGHSYGGYMTAWIIGHDTRFRCAVVADGAVDWKEAYDLSGSGNLSWTRDSLGATPASDPQIYRDGSPITYVGAVKTPTLIITGLSDDVVPFTESWAYYHALRDRGVPVRLVAIPTAHHTPSDPVRLESYYRTIFDWYAAHLGP